MKHICKCKLSKIGICKHAGNKYYNYGFIQGTAAFCKKEKGWIADLKKCPLEDKYNQNVALLKTLTL